MHILIVLANPNETSFNHAIAKQAATTLEQNGHQVTLHDLYKEGFDPNLPGDEIPREGTLPETIATQCKEAADADGIIIVHPNWWGMPPAILTGWVDRIMRPGVAYDFVEGDKGEGVPVGLLKADKAIVFNTSNTSAEREDTIFGDPLQRIWKDCIFDLCGVPDVTRRMFRIIVTSTDEERKNWLDEVTEIVEINFPKA
ncbi:NAD(P)H-dependent oxidoreductase [Pseudodesulfovibrio sediminis]|uniref:NAD(P)H dehydrogenase (Quinone) n=1 Tax=Pseudodesulfovibrio sediminis TaxID=2810563 RepID=A0ABM7P2P3_9BACT|nr:NAD(P)H-dependent oxidoreductase [Pseudodesulfovibrio sediminis]BCS87091.1 NAD(P)H dehydrogenase (quinone) [Pseudodesulfovibrio sediminis]